MAHEPVPQNLELIVKELLVPLHGLFHQLVEQVLPPTLIDQILVVLCGL